MRRFASVVCLLLAVAGCGGTRPIREILPLASDRPTFVFFYTDN
jgi:uncharacterized phage infection (PIP) family protein YhgE